MYKVEDLKQVFIGRRGEKSARVVEIDVTTMLDEAPDATYSIILHRNGDDVPVLCSTTLDGNVLAWGITSTCTALAGIHPFEVRAVQDGQILKSRKAYALVDYSVADYAGEDVPTPLETWVDALQELVDRVEELTDPSTDDDLAYILGV